ncbi:metalloproteinase inhibitor 3 isoform X1 [Hydra vulgaris]|uniref:metalloproteinase inhibitor 3 isoform X1 n=1 Tax=Hydra vulgaris TaxID=6087 RepID=UPI0001926EF7|nr:metalloproteinase inhibitor 3 isoform X1 [Hydra vulgaris]
MKNTSGFCFYLLLASCGIKVVVSCMCMPIHPQSVFCKTEFIIKARILSKEIIKVNYTDENLLNLDILFSHHIVYKILIKSVLKNAKSSYQFNLQQLHSLYTPAVESSCGIQLEIGKPYLLTGKFDNTKLQMNFCDFNMKWHHLTTEIIDGISGKYDCACQITTCMNGYCEKKNSCKWNISWDKPLEDCVYKHLTCGKSNEKCRWNKNSSYKQCLLEEKYFLSFP